MLKIRYSDMPRLTEVLNYSEKVTFCDLQRYRDNCDYSIDGFLNYFSPMIAKYCGDSRKAVELCTKMFSELDPNRDCYYSMLGLKLLQTRYLLVKEPIQFCNARMALKLTRDPFTEWRVFYEFISMGFIHLSSNFARDSFLDTNETYAGEACRLMVIKPDYDYKVLKQIQDINMIQSCGVGIGVNASTVPRFGYEEQGRIQCGFLNFLKSINYAPTIFHRKAKVAVYLHIHCDSVPDALSVKQMSNLDRLDNVFIGLLINKLFIKCLSENASWYLFPSDIKYNNTSLHELVHIEETYEEAYWYLVERKLYTFKLDATLLMERIVRSLVSSGNPYIIWYDIVNKYNNVQHLGPIRTLNLCSEICNYTTDEEPSSCTLATCNIGTIKNEFHRMDFIYKHCEDLRYIDYDVTLHDIKDHEFYQILKYTFTVGFMACIGLNNILGDRKKREIGIGPCGVFDAACYNGALDTDERLVQFTALISEMLYKGSVYGSIWYAKHVGVCCQNWPNSGYSRGAFQFDLRGVKPYTDWSNVRELIKHGATMANSMLTMQAPTASTSVLHGVCESITQPLDIISSRTMADGTVKNIPLGLAYLIRNKQTLNINTDVRQQLKLYTQSAPFIDHSQATTFHLEYNGQLIYDLIIATRAYSGYELKTGIYYILPKVRAQSLRIINDDINNAAGYDTVDNYVTNNINNKNADGYDCTNNYDADDDDDADDDVDEVSKKTCNVKNDENETCDGCSM